MTPPAGHASTGTRDRAPHAQKIRGQNLTFSNSKNESDEKMAKEIETRKEKERIRATIEKYQGLYKPDEEDAGGELQYKKMQAVIRNLARCEVGLEDLYEAQQETGGAVIRHPKHPEMVKPNPLNAEILKQRAQLINYVQTLERYLGKGDSFDEDDLGEFE